MIHIYVIKARDARSSFGKVKSDDSVNYAPVRTVRLSLKKNDLKSENHVF